MRSQGSRRGGVTAGRPRKAGRRGQCGTLLELGCEDRDVSIGLSLATRRSLVAWTGAGVSPDGPAAPRPQAVCPSRQHLLGRNRVCIAWRDPLRSLRAGAPAVHPEGATETQG